MLDLSSIFLFNFFYMYFATWPRPALTAVIRFWPFVGKCKVIYYIWYIWPKLWNLAELVEFDQNCEIWLNLWNLVEIVKFDQNTKIWSKLWNLVKIVKFGWSCKTWVKFGHPSSVLWGFGLVWKCRGGQGEEWTGSWSCPLWVLWSGPSWTILVPLARF